MVFVSQKVDGNMISLLITEKFLFEYFGDGKYGLFSAKMLMKR